jgi:hypothetical protein
MLDNMVKSPKLVLMANTLPLYLTTWVFLVDSKPGCWKVIKSVFGHLTQQISEIKKKQNSIRQRTLVFH